MLFVLLLVLLVIYWDVCCDFMLSLFYIDLVRWKVVLVVGILQQMVFCMIIFLILLWFILLFFVVCRCSLSFLLWFMLISMVMVIRLWVCCGSFGWVQMLFQVWWVIIFWNFLLNGVRLVRLCLIWVLLSIVWCICMLVLQCCFLFIGGFLGGQQEIDQVVVEGVVCFDVGQVCGGEFD